MAEVDESYYDDDDELRLNFSGVDEIRRIGECGTCEGRGEIEGRRCADCDGKGVRLIPSGIQHCIITKAEKVPAGPNAKFPGQPVLSLEFTVASGDYEGQKIWDRIAVGKDSLFKEDGEPSFAFQKLKSLLGALGYDNSGDLRFRVSDWLERHIDIRVGRKAAQINPVTQEEYGAKNTAAAFYPHEMTEAEALR